MKVLNENLIIIKADRIDQYLKWELCKSMEMSLSDFFLPIRKMLESKDNVKVLYQITHPPMQNYKILAKTNFSLMGLC